MRTRVRLLCVGLGFLLASAVLLSCSDSGTAPDEHGHDPAEGNCGHLEGDGYILDSGGQDLVFGWRGAQTGELEVREGELGAPMTMRFLDADSVLFGVADNCEDNSLGIVIDDPEMLEVVRDPGVEWTFRLRGLLAGETTLTLRGMHEGHSHIATLPIPVTVAAAQTGGLTLSGSVNLSVTLFSEFGDSLGSEIQDDVSGIRVYLERPNGERDSTLTEEGTFRFVGLGDGDHALWSGPEEAPSAVVHQVLAGSDADIGALAVKPIGRLRNPPNPFAYSHGTGIEWDLAVGEPVEIRIFSAAATQVWSYAYDAPAGFQHIHWIGTDQSNQPLPPGPYWATVHYEGRWHSRIVIKLAE